MTGSPKNQAQPAGKAFAVLHPSGAATPDLTVTDIAVGSRMQKG